MDKATLQTIEVLVIDDEPFAQRFVTRVLNSIGIEKLITAENGAQALELLQAATAPIDLIICDIEMPEMNGFEFVRRIRYGIVPEIKNIPILMLTGQDTDQNIKSARIHKINGYVVKPPKADTLQEKIIEVMGL